MDRDITRYKSDKVYYNLYRCGDSPTDYVMMKISKYPQSFCSDQIWYATAGDTFLRKCSRYSHMKFFHDV